MAGERHGRGMLCVNPPLNFLMPQDDKLLQYAGNYNTYLHSLKYHNARIFIKHRGEKLAHSTLMIG
jgi:hypothetical protein